MRTAEELMARGLVPAGPVKALVDQWETKSFEGRVSLREITGLSAELLAELKSGKKQAIGFDAADKIVCCLSHRGWRWSDELYAIYSTFDFSSLDRLKPCARLAA